MVCFLEVVDALFLIEAVRNVEREFFMGWEVGIDNMKGAF